MEIIRNYITKRALGQSVQVNDIPQAENVPRLILLGEEN